MNKVNLESGLEPGSSRPELALEKSGQWVESRHRKERGGTWRLQFSLIWEMWRGSHISTSSLICQVFAPISVSRVFSGNGTTELDTASLEDV